MREWDNIIIEEWLKSKMNTNLRYQGSILVRILNTRQQLENWPTTYVRFRKALDCLNFPFRFIYSIFVKAFLARATRYKAQSKKSGVSKHTTKAMWRNAHLPPLPAAVSANGRPPAMRSPRFNWMQCQSHIRVSDAAGFIINSGKDIQQRIFRKKLSTCRWKCCPVWFRR